MHIAQHTSRITDLVPEVLRLYELGLPQYRIAADVGVKASTVHGVLQEHSLPTRYNHNYCRELDQHQRSVLLGTLLGDGSLDRGANDTSTPALRLSHGEQQRAYLVWKTKQLSPLFRNRTPYEYLQKTGHRSYYAHSRRHPLLRGYFDLLYSRPRAECSSSVHRKRITSEILTRVDDEAFAIWWCDDGVITRRRGNVRDRLGLVVGAVTPGEYWLVDQFLKRHRGWWCSMSCSTTGNSVTWYFDADTSEEIARVIYPYVPSCMRYKLGKIDHGCR